MYYIHKPPTHRRPPFPGIVRFVILLMNHVILLMNLPSDDSASVMSSSESRLEEAFLLGMVQAGSFLLPQDQLPDAAGVAAETALLQLEHIFKVQRRRWGLLGGKAMGRGGLKNARK